jgi:hypothetical protein
MGLHWLKAIIVLHSLFSCHMHRADVSRHDAWYGFNAQFSYSSFGCSGWMPICCCIFFTIMMQLQLLLLEWMSCAAHRLCHTAGLCERA